MALLKSGTRIYGNLTVDTFVTATGNVAAGNVLTNNLLYANGVAWALGGGANISNGTSNINIATSGGNILFGVSGTANVVTLNTSAGWTFLDSSAQNTGMNFGRVTATVQGWNLP